MPQWIRIALGVVIGFVAWFVVATVGNLLLRGLLTGYAQAEPAMTFTLPMQLARLVLGAISSVAAGFACAASMRSVASAVRYFAAFLVLFFIPVHYSLWTRFPLWYHVVFLGSLAPLALLGGSLARVGKSR